MAPPLASNHPSEDETPRQRSSNARPGGRDLLDEATKRFEAMIEERNKTNKPFKVVRGGLPPHLIRQSQQGSVSSSPRNSSPPQTQAQPQHKPGRPEQLQPQQAQSQQYQDSAAESSRPHKSPKHPAGAQSSGARGKKCPPLDYGPNKDFNPLPSAEDALRRQKTLQSRASRPRVFPSPLEGHDAHDGQPGPSKVAHQQELPLSPTCPNDMPESGGTMVFRRAKDNPSLNPCMKGIMNSKWTTAERVFTPFHERQQQKFAKVAREEALRTQKISSVPQHGPSALPLMASAPQQRQSSALGHDARVRVSVTTSLQGSQPVISDEQRGVIYDTHPSTAIQATYTVAPPEKKQKWRPKHSVDLESQSLPSAISSVQFDEYGADFHDVSNAGPVSDDVRGRIADEMDLARKRDGE